MVRPVCRHLLKSLVVVVALLCSRKPSAWWMVSGEVVCCGSELPGWLRLPRSGVVKRCPGGRGRGHFLYFGFFETSQSLEVSSLEHWVGVTPWIQALLDFSSETVPALPHAAPELAMLLQMPEAVEQWTCEGITASSLSTPRGAGTLVLGLYWTLLDIFWSIYVELQFVLL